MTRTLPEPPVEAIDLSAVLSALADPNRRALLTELYLSVGAVDCGALDRSVATGLSAPTLSHHFRVLREAGLTRTILEGRTRVMSVRREDVEARFPGLLASVIGVPAAHARAGSPPVVGR